MGQSESKDNAAHLNEKDCEAASDGLQNAAENGPRTLEQEIKELKPHQREALKREKWEGFEHLIIPHTDAAGDPYYMGDIYEGIKLADKWKINEYVFASLPRDQTDSRKQKPGPVSSIYQASFEKTSAPGLSGSLDGS